MKTNRRSFLQTSSSVVATGCLTNIFSLRSEASSSASKLRPIGFSLYGMKSLPVLEALEQCARIGYDNVEICIMDEFPTALEEFSLETQKSVRDRAQKLNLEISSLLFHGAIFGNEEKQQYDLETIRRAGDISRVLNPEKPPLLESVMGGKKGNWETDKNLMADRLGKWAEAAASVGVQVAVKAHAGNTVYAADQLLWLYRTVNHPALTLTYDYSHYKVEGFEMEPTMREVIPHAGFIHVKDVIVATPYRFILPGEGTIDWSRYFQILRELNYHGPLLVEVSAHVHRLPTYEPLTAAQACYTALSKARDEAYRT
jgi:inosose dehydratase